MSQLPLRHLNVSSQCPYLWETSGLIIYRGPVSCIFQVNIKNHSENKINKIILHNVKLQEAILFPRTQHKISPRNVIHKAKY